MSEHNEVSRRLGHATVGATAETYGGLLPTQTAGETDAEEQRIARLVTSSVAGTRWRELTPLDIARHLVANGVRVVIEVDR